MDIELKKAFGKNLKNARISKNLSIYKLAKLCNKTPQYFSALERGEASLPSEITIKLICEQLNIDSNIVMKSIKRLPQHIVNKIINNPNLWDYIESY